MFYRVVFLLLTMCSVFSAGPFRKHRVINRDCSCQKNLYKITETKFDPAELLDPDVIVDRIRNEIKKTLKKLPKIIIIPPPSEEDWESGEVAWEPKDPPENRNGNWSGQGIHVRQVPPMTPLDFAMSTI
jgi:hypothetical protein